MNYRHATAALFIIAAAGCTQGTDAKQSASQIASLNRALGEAEARIEKLESSQKLREILDGSSSRAYLDPMSDGYGIVRTDIGPVLVSFLESAPKADGTEISLQVGNPSSASIVGAKFYVDYNIRQDGSPEWQSTLKTTEYTAINPLHSGSWSKVKIPLPSIKPDRLGYLSIRIDTNEVRLTPAYQ